MALSIGEAAIDLVQWLAKDLPKDHVLRARLKHVLESIFLHDESMKAAANTKNSQRNGRMDGDGNGRGRENTYRSVRTEKISAESTESGLAPAAAEYRNHERAKEIKRARDKLQEKERKKNGERANNERDRNE